MTKFRTNWVATVFFVCACTSFPAKPPPPSGLDIIHTNERESQTLMCSEEYQSNNGKVNWYFVSSYIGFMDHSELVQQHLRDLKGKNVLMLRNISKKHDGTYKCVVTYDNKNSHILKKYRLLVHSSPSEMQLLLFAQDASEHIPLFLLMMLITIVISIAFLLYKLILTLKEKQKSKSMRLYISHCSKPEEQKQNVLNFSYWLESQLPGRTVVVDLMNKAEMINKGDLVKWVPHQMGNVDKIIVILSEEYVDALKSFGEDINHNTMTTKTPKVLIEYECIKKMVDKDLIICWQSGDLAQLPLIFQRQSYYLLPRFNNGYVLKDNACLNILAALRSEIL